MAKPGDRGLRDRWHHYGNRGAAAESGPDPAARVSVVASIGYVANLAAPPAVGLLSQSFGLLDALWLVVAFLALSFAVSGVLHSGATTRT